MQSENEIQQTKAAQSECRRHRLLIWHLNLTGVDGVDDVVGRLAVDGAADRLRCAEDLLGAVGKVLGERL